MENERFTMKEATALLVAARCHRETLEGVYSAMVRNGERGLPGAQALEKEIETLAGAADKLKNMIEEDRQCTER